MPIFVPRYKEICKSVYKLNEQYQLMNITYEQKLGIILLPISNKQKVME